MTRRFGVALLGTVLLLGCGGGQPVDDHDHVDEPTTGTDDPPSFEGLTSEPVKGLHGGQLIELGEHEYHGELVHDDETGAVTIWLLDADLAALVPIPDEKIVMNVRHDGDGRQFDLAAKPEESDPDGTSSRFHIDDKELGDHLHHDDDEIHLVVTIEGKQFRGIVVHDHDHEGEHKHHNH